MAGKGKGKKEKGSKTTETTKTMIKQELKAISRRQIETKTINVPDVTTPSTNTLNLPYLSASGVQYLCADIFSNLNGPTDSTVIPSASRIGDKVRGVGFLCDYYFSIIPSVVNPTPQFLPYVKLRVIIYRGYPVQAALTTNLLIDGNFMGGINNQPTLNPTNWKEGFLKDVLYDKVHVIENDNIYQPTGGSNPANNVYGKTYHWKKYFKFDEAINYNANNTTFPNSTNKPLFLAIIAEYDDTTANIASGTKILFTTGYTKAFFKDA